jgi:Ca2+-binding RTX toxin-like protein
MGKRVAVLSALLALLATFLLVQPAGAQEDDPCANPPPGAILGTAGNDVLRGTPGRMSSSPGRQRRHPGSGRRRPDLRRARQRQGRHRRSRRGGRRRRRGPGRSRRRRRQRRPRGRLPALAQGNDTGIGGPGDDFIIGGFGADILLGGFGADGLFGGQDSDLLNGGAGDDLLVGDIPNMASEDGLPPTVDPTEHVDVCIGAGGTDQAFTCEREVAIWPPVASRLSPRPG